MASILARVADDEGNLPPQPIADAVVTEGLLG